MPLNKRMHECQYRYHGGLGGGNLLSIRKTRKTSFLKRLGAKFTDNTTMLSRGGLYFDRYMKEIPNHVLKRTFNKKNFTRL